MIGQNIAFEINKIREQAGKHILIFGNPTIANTLTQQCMIDSYGIFINPVLFGQGIPLFKSTETKSALRLEATKPFANS